MLTKLPTDAKLQLLRQYVIHQTVIRLKANKQHDNDTALHAEIERDIAIKAISHIKPSKDKL